MLNSVNPIKVKEAELHSLDTVIDCDRPSEGLPPKTAYPLALTLPIAAFVLAFLAALVASERFYHESEALVADRYHSALKSAAVHIEETLQQTYQKAQEDALFVSQLPSVRALVDEYAAKNTRGNGSTNPEPIGNTFLPFMRTKSTYTQLQLYREHEGVGHLINVVRQPSSGQTVLMRGKEREISEFMSAANLALGQTGPVFSAMRYTAVNEEPWDSQVLLGTVFSRAYGNREQDGYAVIALSFDINTQLKTATIGAQQFSVSLATRDGKLIQTGVVDNTELPNIESYLEDPLLRQKVHHYLDSHGLVKPTYIWPLDIVSIGIREPLILVLQAEHDVVAEQLQGYRQAGYLLACLMLVFALAIAAFFYRRITSPLNKMAKAVKEFERTGKLVGLPVSSKDEIGSLARSINHFQALMSGALASQQQSNDNEKNAREHLQAILDSATDAIIAIDEKGIILSINQASMRIFGYEEGEIIGQPIRLLIPCENVDRAEIDREGLDQKDFESPEALTESYFQSKESAFLARGKDFVAKRKDGKPFYVHFSLSRAEINKRIVFTGFIADVSERKAKEDQLCDARKYIDAVTESVPVQLAYIDVNLVYKFVNNNYAQWHDSLPENVIGSRVPELLSEEQFSKAHPFIEQALAGESVTFSIKVHRHEDFRYLDAKYIPDFDGNDKVQGMFVSIEDVTAIRTNEARLQELSERFDFALNAPNIGVWDLNLSTDELIWDQRMYDLYGAESNCGENAFGEWKSRLHPEDFVPASNAIKKALDVGQDLNCQYRVVLPSGEIRYIESHGKIMLDDTGKQVRMIGTNRDISETVTLAHERERALEIAKINEENLIEIRDRLEFALTEPPIGVWDYNLKTHELIWDDRIYDIYGVKKSEAISTQEIWRKGMHPEDVKMSLQRIGEAVENGEKFNGTFRVIWPNKEVRTIEAHGKVMCNEQGEPDRLVGTNRDITEVVQLAAEREVALEEAKASARLKSEFLASMSHEIRTPMNGVLGMLGLLLRSNLDDVQKRYANLAQSSAQSLLTLVNDILDFSKVEAGKLDLEILDFDLISQLGEFSESMALRAQEKDIELILDVSQVTTSYVRGDPGRIRQIFTNLVSNAIKFTDDGEIIIRAALTEHDDDHLCLTCSVSDTGIGIKPEKLTGIFDSFTQVDASTTRKYGGTGLGLAIVAKLCQLMGGEIHAESDLGKGSCFRFHVIVQKSSRSTQVLPQVDIKDLNILVVDDNETNRLVLSKQLEVWGTKPWEASSAAQAISILERESCKEQGVNFDVAFLDMQMPVITGADLGKILKADKRFHTIPLVMMTSMSSRGDGAYFASLGFSAYFPKPATTSDLFDALSLVVSGGQALEQASPLITHHYLKSLDRLDNEIEWPSATRILLVEDNPVNQEVASGILEDIGLACDISGNGVEAINALKSSPSDARYTIILMDCQMPEMDGYETSQRIRLGEVGDHYREIPILAMTANAMKGDRDKCLQSGMSDYLSKPVDPDVLTKKLQLWLKQNTMNDDKPQQQRHRVNPKIKAALVWDKETAFRRVRNKNERMVRLVTLFLDGMPERIENLRLAVKNGDLKESKEIAHAIKGVAANLGADMLASAMAEMEKAGKEGDAEALSVNLPMVEESYQKVNAILDAFLADQQS